MAVDWFEPIRAYCERTDAAFWAEPVDAVSNTAFLVAAAFGIRASRDADDVPCLTLSILVGIVGIGSFLFHTLAVRWAMLADVLPIAAFVVGYFLLALRRFIGLRAAPAVLLALLFALLDVGLSPALEAATGLPLAAATNGSLDYLPAFVALLGVSAALAVDGNPDRPLRRATARRLATIAVLFLVSLTFRTVDRAACAAFPVGTHWVWHVLNAVVLSGLVATALAWRRPADP